MQPFANILLPVDGSPQSRVSENMAASISKLFNSQITLIHVVTNQGISLPGRVYVPRENLAPISTATGQFPRTIIIPKPEEYLIPDAVVKEATESYNERAENILSEAANSLANEGIAVSRKRIINPNVADGIIDEIEAGKYNLVIMGNTGNEENPLDLHLGSVAAKVSANNLTSTLVVRRKTQLKTILLSVEDPVKDEKAINTAFMLAKAAGSKVLLLHVQEKHFLRSIPQMKEVGNQILSQTKSLLEGIEVEHFLEIGDPASVILDTAEQASADLVVLGRGGHGKLAHLLGSVSDHVLHYATVPVLLSK